VDNYDLASLAALRYAKSLRLTSLRAVHFVIDHARADRLREQWLDAGTGVQLDLVDSPDRRLARAVTELAAREAARPGTQVTVVLPRRSYSPLPGRLLHDHTADKIARVVSRIPDAVATIIPFDVRHGVETLHARHTVRAAMAAVPGSDGHPSVPVRTPGASLREYEWPVAPVGTDPIGSLRQPGRASVQGRVHTVEFRPVDHNCVLACQIADATGALTALFYGRKHIAGIEPGSKIRLHGTVCQHDAGEPEMINPAYTLVDMLHVASARGSVAHPGVARSDLDDADAFSRQQREILGVGGEQDPGSGRGECGGSHHGVDRVLVAVQTVCGKESRRGARDVLGDGFNN
jgi:hypothetical protein